MPTYNRRNKIRLALNSYLAQDHQDRELIVVDDGDDSVKDLLHDIPGVIYYRPIKAEAGMRMTIGAKRNMACRIATGDVIVHFDDDDWSAANRISHQLTLMALSGKDVVGYNTLLFLHEVDNKIYKYLNAQGAVYSCGTCLCYTRAWWEEHPFEARDVSEDNAFLFAARGVDNVYAENGEKHMVARIHSSNTNKYDLSLRQWWEEIPIGQVPKEFLSALAAV
jgi:glycosyltransferase involved in cell wall biosynthesis